METGSTRSSRAFWVVIWILIAGFTPVTAFGQSYLLSEGFEGTGYENTGWTSFSSIDPDFTASPLVGAQSLRCNGTSSFIQRAFVRTNDFHCYFQVRWLAFAPYKFVVDWLDAGASSITRVVTDGFPNRLQLVHGAVSATGSTVISTNITYDVWVEWTRGSGANGNMKLFVSTNGVKPASPEATITTGNGTNIISKFDVGPFDGASTTDVIYDRVLIDDEPIGSNPGGNSPPSISTIANQTTPEGTTIGPIAFTIGDAETNASALVLTAASSNTNVVPNANIVFGGSNSNRTVTITPVSGIHSNTTITISVSDGQSSSFTSFNLAVGNANAPGISGIANQSVPINTSAGPMNFTIGDVETAAASLTLSGTSTNTTLVPNANIVFGGSGSNRTVTITPATDQSGVTLVTVFVSDGQLTNSTSFTFTVGAANTAPTISNIPNQTTPQDTTLGPIQFTIGDTETPASSLNISRSSSNLGLLPLDGIVVAGSETARTITLTPAAGQTGNSSITLTVSDGELSASHSFVLSVTATNPPIGNPGEWILREGFEGVGYENPGWTQLSGPNPDYTATVLHGDESLHLMGGSLIRRTFQPTNEFHLYCQLHWKNLVRGATVFYWETFGYDAAATLLIDYSLQRLYVSHGDSVAIGTTILQTNSTYHVWLEWSRGAGNNGTMKVFLSTNATKPALPEAALTNGVGQDIERMYVGSIHSAPDLIVDSIFIADKPIGSDPGSNAAPTISDMADQIIDEDTSTGPISFTIGDLETAATNLTVSGLSSNQALVPHNNIVFGGSGSNRTVTVTPTPNASGITIITVTVTDGLLSTNETFMVTVNPVNDAPLVTLPMGSTNYTENSGPIVLDPDATLVDVDSPDFNSGTITVDFTANGSPEDRLAIRNQGTGSGEVGVGGADISYEGANVAAFTGGSDGSTPLVIRFNASATPQVAQAVLRNITFENISDTPSAAERTVRVVVDDGDGGTCAPATMMLSIITLPNDPGLTWSSPAPIVYGTPLSSAQLNASASVPGVFTYIPPDGTVLSAGTDQVLAVTFTPEDSVNYSSTSSNVNITVTTATLQVTANVTNRAYGQTNPPFSVSYTGFVNGDDQNQLSGTLVYTTQAETNSPVGSYPIIPSGLTASSNYTLNFANGELTVSAALLVATADDQTKLYGTDMPALTGMLIGVQNSDGITASFTCTASSSSPVGTYGITPILSDPNHRLTNYSVTLNEGMLTISPANGITISILGVETNGTATLRVTSDPGQRFTIQATTNLIDWIDLITLHNITGTIDNIDTGSAGLPYRFYRTTPVP